MRLQLYCMQCLAETGHAREQVERVEFRDDGRYEIVCPAGHTTVTVLQQQKFEILVEIAAYAIKDGYYREAVSSFTSALERFYEFAIRVLLQNTFDNDKVYKSCWKHVASQSERQLGAFVFLWASKFGEPPDLLSNRHTKFRNAVIHKGRIPAKDEAIEYGDAILSILRLQMHTLRQRYSEDVQKVVVYHLMDCRSAEDGGRPVTTMGISTLVCLAVTDDSYHKLPLNEYLETVLARQR